MKTVSTITPNKLSWTDIYFTAEALKEPFENVHVITVKSFLTERAWEAAQNQLGFEEGWVTILLYACELLDSGTVYTTEHVSVSSDGIRVVIDAEEIGEDAVWRALDMVAAALDKLDGKGGTVLFSSAIKYASKDISWLNLH